MAKKVTTAPVSNATPYYIYVCAALFLGTFILYGNTLTNGFALDDTLAILKNQFTQKGLKGIPDIFSNDTFKAFFQTNGSVPMVEGGRFRPFSIAIFALLVQIFGNTPLPFHLFNLLLYGLTAWTLYRTLHYLLHPTAAHGFWNIPFLASALFIAHPIHTEVVANIKCADELWTLLFSLLTLHRAARFHDSGERRHVWIGALYFLLACFSKENAITFLAVIPMAIACFRANTPAQGQLLRFMLPIAGSFLFFLLWRGWVLDWNFSSINSKVLINNPFIVWDGTQWQPMPLGQRTASIIYSLGKYLALLVFPHPLTHDYYPRQIGIVQWSDWRAILSLVAYLAIAAGVVWGWKKDKIIGFAALFFLATLSIVSNIPFQIGTNLSERFIYMPSVAFCLLVAYAMHRYLTPRTGFLVLALLLLPYAYKTITRNRDWKDNLTLAQADIQVSAQSAKINNSLGSQLTEKALKINNVNEKTRVLVQAIGCFNKALEINPTYIEAFFGRGSAYFLQNNLSAAIQDYLSAEKIDPNYPSLKDNLALALREAGKAALRNNDPATAKRLLQDAQRRYPSDAEINQLLQQLNQQ